MNLLIDIGNTRIKSAVSHGVGLNAQASSVWRDRNPNEVFTSLWHDVSPARVIVSNVAGDTIAEQLRHWCDREEWPKPEFAKSESKSGDLMCAYANPSQLGVDRWVALQGALTITDSAVLVIDCGTATTVDLVTSKKIHRGGAILPGISTMRRALAGGTANLDVPAGQVKAFADNTRDAIAGGTAYTLAGAIDRLAIEAKNLCDESIINIITGGEAELVRPLLFISTQINADLVLLGLEAIAENKLN